MLEKTFEHSDDEGMIPERSGIFEDSDSEDSQRKKEGKFGNDSSEDGDEEYPTRSRLSKNKKGTLDISHMIGKGSFLPIIVAAEKDQVDPSKIIIDTKSGATTAHYAAHYGNLKFLRWYLKQEYQPDIQDFYQCTLLHYSVRQGHLPILIYLVENFKISLTARDKFGYSVLEYSLIYKKLYCFIYIFYKCRH